MEASIQRYTRNITTGALTQSDQTTDTAPYNVIKAATSDSSGDWLVRVTTRTADTSMITRGDTISSRLPNVQHPAIPVMCSAITTNTLRVAMQEA